MTNQLDFIKIKNFCSAKDNVKEKRRWATDSVKIFAHLMKDGYPTYT